LYHTNWYNKKEIATPKNTMPLARSASTQAKTKREQKEEREPKVEREGR